MLLISVDRSYGQNASKSEGKAQNIFKKLKIKWGNVFEPDGWEGVMRRFNVSGYGSILVDPNGIVRGVDLHARQIKQLMKKIYPSKASDKTNKDAEVGNGG